MGAADVVPGVSGGTMAFILGIYEELIQSIRSVTQKPFLDAIKKFDIKAGFSAVNAFFLIAIGSGILLAIITLAHSLEQALETYPEFVWSFFFGLVLASIFIIRKRVGKWTPKLATITILGVVSSFMLVGLVPLETPSTWWFLVLSGALAICAMILPGVSGAFILVLLGKYEFVLQAVTSGDYASLMFIAIGAGIGILTFARLLGWLFQKHHNGTVAVLIGLMIGSLRKIWPWKEVADSSITNILPTINTSFGIAIALVLTGFLTIVVLERIAANHKQAS